MSKHTSPDLSCSAGEYQWLQIQLVTYRQALTRSILQVPVPLPGIPVKENKKESTQAYLILVEFFQRAVSRFKPKPGDTAKLPIRISNSFVKALKSLDKDGLINIDLVSKNSGSITHD